MTMEYPEARQTRPLKGESGTHPKHQAPQASTRVMANESGTLLSQRLANGTAARLDRQRASLDGLQPKAVDCQTSAWQGPGNLRTR